jgi:ABC-type uncharacterized transport system permease subunit
VSLRKYWATAALAATSIAGESPLFLADYVLRFVQVAVLLTLWRVVLGGQTQDAGMSLAAVLTYTLIAQAFADQLKPRAGIADSMWTGSFANHFTRPMSIVGQFVAEMAGRWTFGLAFFAVPLLLCAPLFGVDPRPADPLHSALFITSLALGVAVGLALDFIFGALTVQLDMGPWVIERLYHAVGTLLSGALLPLALLPWGLGDALQWLPFAAMASAPLRIYTGTGDPLPLMGSQAVWAMALWPLAQWIWRANRERLTTYGG